MFFWFAVQTTYQYSHLISANRIQFPSTNLIILESDHVLQNVTVAITFNQYSECISYRWHLKKLCLMKYILASTTWWWKMLCFRIKHLLLNTPVWTQTIHLHISNFNTFYFHQFATRPTVHSMKCLKLYLKYLTFECSYVGEFSYILCLYFNLF